MKVTLAKSSGFCFGVKNAVSEAERMIIHKKPGERLVMLGELTHNEKVVEKLLEGGFEIFNDASEVPEGSSVIIRAHGVTPNQKKTLQERNCKIFDCTCPFVDKIHKIVKEQALNGKDIIIAGGKGHPEVIGICGEAPEDKVHVVSSVSDVEELEAILPNSILVSQTTFSSEEFKKICAFVENKIDFNFIFGTICCTTSNRQKEASDIATKSDVMIVIGSAHSSNTHKLYDVCSSRCDRTFLISDNDDLLNLIENGSISTSDSVGVTAGASTPESIILEVVRTMNENETMNQNQEFLDYMEGMTQLKRGATVKGNITSADSDFVYVDVRDKSEGKIPKREFDGEDFDIDAAIANRQEITVVVKSIRNSDLGKEIILSKSQVDYEKNKGIIEEAYNNKTPITVKITSVAKDGVIGKFGGIDIYIHKTQLMGREVSNLDEYINKTLDIIISKFATEKGRLRISGSHRAILTAERKEKEDAIWADIEVGKVYKGIVRNLTDFGAFVDIGGVDGLVHITELSWKKIRKASDVLSKDQEIEVYVKSIDTEKKKISLGYKKPEDDPYYNIEERIPVGSIVKGKVVRIKDFGAFVQLEPDLDALCHVSQISTVRLKTPADVLKEGMEVIAKVTDIKIDERKINISIREVEPIDPEVVEEPEASEEEGSEE